MLRLLLDQLPGLAIGGLLAAAGLIVYNTVWENPQVRAETAAIVQAENAKLTQEAINEVASNADKARAMRRYCVSIGRVYDFATAKCRD